MADSYSDSDHEPEVLFRARLTRETPDTPWGFRLQGGASSNKPLTLLKVLEESVAARHGLQAGDIVVKLAGCGAQEMTHKHAQEAIRAAEDSLEIIVQRSEETSMSTPVSPPLAPQENGEDQKTNQQENTHADRMPDDAFEVIGRAIEDISLETWSSGSSSGSSEDIPAMLSRPSHIEVGCGQVVTLSQSNEHLNALTDIAGDLCDRNSSLDISSHATNTRLDELSEETSHSRLDGLDSASIDFQQSNKNSLAQYDQRNQPSLVDIDGCISDDETSQRPPQSNIPVCHAQTSQQDVYQDENSSLEQTNQQGNTELLLTSANEIRPGRLKSEKVQTTVSTRTENRIKRRISDGCPVYLNNSSSSGMVDKSSSRMSTSNQAAEDKNAKHSLAETGKSRSLDDSSMSSQIEVDLYPWRRHRPGSNPGMASMHAPNESSEMDSSPMMFNQSNNAVPDYPEYFSDSPISSPEPMTPSLRLVGKRIDNRTHVNSPPTYPANSPPAPPVYPTNSPPVYPTNSPPAPPAYPVNSPPSYPAAPQHPPPAYPSQSPPAYPGASSYTDRAPPSYPGSSVMVQHAAHSNSQLQGGHNTSTNHPILVSHEKTNTTSISTHAQLTTNNNTQIGSNSNVSLAVATNNQYVAPGIQDIYFSDPSAGPDLVDIPLADVKDLVADLNRRLESIAAQHPHLAEDMGMEFIQTDKDIPADTSTGNATGVSADVKEGSQPEILVSASATSQNDINSLKNRIFGNSSNDAESMKVYDIKSPISSPKPHRKVFLPVIIPVSPPDLTNKGSRKVHFRDPIEQSVHEIPNARTDRKERRREVNKQVGRELESLGAQQLKDEVVKAEIDLAEVKAEIDLAKQHILNMSQSSGLAGPQMPRAVSVPINIIHEKPVEESVGNHNPSSGHNIVPGHNSVPGHKPISGHNATSSQHSTVSGHNTVTPGPASEAHVPGQISVSISRKSAGSGGAGSANSQQTFTLPPTQPGQPRHYHYTIQGAGHRKASQPFPSGHIQYSFPPSYDESVRIRRGRRSLDESMASVAQAAAAEHAAFMRTASGPLSPTLQRDNMDTWPRYRQMSSFRSAHSAPAAPPPPYTGSTAGYSAGAQRGSSLSPSPDTMQSRTQRALETQAYARSTPLRSGTPVPTYNISPQGPLSPNPPSHISNIQDTTQSKSFKALEAHLLDGGRRPVNVQVLGQPSHVLQPAAVGRPFTPSFAGVREEASPTEQEILLGRRMSGSSLPPITGFGSHYTTGSGNQSDLMSLIPPPGMTGTGVPGVFALFDNTINYNEHDLAFAEKVLNQWRGQGPRSHFQSETYKLVHEMDDIQKQHEGRGGPTKPP